MLTAVLIGASIGLSARASGDVVEDRAFLQTLDEFQVVYPSPGVALGWGQGVCSALDAGASVPQVMSGLVVYQDLRPSEAAHVTGAAIGSLCQDHLEALDDGRGFVA